MIHNNNGNFDSLHTDNSRHHIINTTNNIYLQPGSNQSEFDNWMRQIGSLLHIGAEHSGIKPILDLLVAVIEPERIFLLSNPAINEHHIKACLQIILIVDDKKNPSDALYSFVTLACIKIYNVTISVHSSQKMEAGIKDGHSYYSTHCKAHYLVFSGSSYRLSETPMDLMADISKETNKEFHAGINKATELWKLACDLVNNKHHNHAALMLHQSVEQVYRTILWAFNQESPATHRLEKLERKAANFIPQILYAMTNKSDLESLDMAYNSQVYPHFAIDEICEVSGLCTQVSLLIQIALTAFQDKQSRLFGKLNAVETD